MIMVKDCADVVSQILAINVKDIYGDRRQKHIVEARFLTYWASKEYTRFSFPRIGRAMKKDHTAILHGVKYINKKLEEKEPRLVCLCKQIKDELDNRYGDIDEEVITECHENEIRELLPELTKQLHALTIKLFRDKRNEPQPVE